MSKVIKVRIPAVISHDGRWSAYGYPAAERDPDWSMVEEVADNGDDVPGSYKRVWVIVELPLPDIEEVEAAGVISEGK